MTKQRYVVMFRLVTADGTVDSWRDYGHASTSRVEACELAEKARFVSTLRSPWHGIKYEFKVMGKKGGN